MRHLNALEIAGFVDGFLDEEGLEQTWRHLDGVPGVRPVVGGRSSNRWKSGWRAPTSPTAYGRYDPRSASGILVINP